MMSVQFYISLCQLAHQTHDIQYVIECNSVISLLAFAERCTYDNHQKELQAVNLCFAGKRKIVPGK